MSAEAAYAKALHELTEKRRQIEEQILDGRPRTYEDYRSLCALRAGMMQCERFLRDNWADSFGKMSPPEFREQPGAKNGGGSANQRQAAY